MHRNKLQVFALISTLCITSCFPSFVNAVELDGVGLVAKATEKDITVAKDLVICGIEGFTNIRVTANDSGKICGKLRVGDTAKILEKEKDSKWYKIQSGELVGYVLKEHCLTGKDIKYYIDEHKDLFKYEVKSKNYKPVGVYSSEFSSLSDNLVYSSTGKAIKDTYVYLSKDSDKSQDQTQPTDVYRAYSEDGFTSFYDKQDEDSIRHGLIPNDTELNIIEIDDEWTKVKWAEVDGYIKSMNMKHSVENIPLSNIASTIKVDEEVKVYDIDKKGWATVESKDTIGFVKVKYLDLTYISNSLASNVLSYSDSLAIEDWSSDFAYIKNEDESLSCISLANCDIVIIDKDAEVVNYDRVSGKKLDMSKLKDGETTKKRTKIVNYALKFVGNPYVWGGTSLTNGADCSGYVQSVLKHYDISIPRVACDQATAGKAVKPEKIRVGDLVFYEKDGVVNHVAMYIGNGEVVHASSPSSGIKISKVDYRNVVAIRNVID